MKRYAIAAVASLAAPLAAPALAQEHREAEAHVHGVSQLLIALEDGVLELDLTSPGADITGFEHEPESAADRAAVGAAVAGLAQAEALFTLPEAAGCYLVEARSHVHDAAFHAAQDDHADDHDDHDHDDHDHDADHDHEHEHEEAHDDHDHDHGAHSEFHANYTFRCAQPEALTEIAFPFFGVYANAQEIEVQYVTDSGAGAAEVTAGAATLALD